MGSFGPLNMISKLNEFITYHKFQNIVQDVHKLVKVIQVKIICLNN